MAYSLDIVHIYHTDHIAIIKSCNPDNLMEAVNQHFDLELTTAAIDSWFNNEVLIDTGEEVYINEMDCPIMHSITITEI